MPFDIFSSSKHKILQIKNVQKNVLLIQFIDTNISQDDKYIENFVWTFCQKYLKYVFIMGD